MRRTPPGVLFIGTLFDSSARFFPEHSLQCLSSSERRKVFSVICPGQQRMPESALTSRVFTRRPLDESFSLGYFLLLPSCSDEL